MYRPIIILGMARSGTSLTAGIFKEHGCWVGKCSAPWDQYPLGDFENKAIKTILHTYPPHWRMKEPCPPDPKFSDKAIAVIKSEGYTGGPLAVKHSAMYWKMWKVLDPFYVNVRRDTSQIVDSLKRKGLVVGGMKDWMDRITWHNEQMNRTVNEHNGVDIHPDHIIQGNHVELEMVLDWCGLKYDKAAVDKVLQPKYWGRTA